MSAAARYRVRHETVYTYGGEVAHSHQLLHLTPRPLALQTCTAHSLELRPPPGLRRDDIDAFGNPVTRLEYDRPHERLDVIAETQVELRAPAPVDPAASHPWEAVRAALGYTGAAPAAEDLEAGRYRMESPYVRIKQTFSDYTENAFSENRPILAAALELMHQLHRDFSYAPGTTDVKTSVLDAFEARRGVCQDFAHIMIACLRSRGLAARYVSGYLRTQPVGANLGSWVGADASHAWVSVFCPPLGWIDLDPTNDVPIRLDHITVAWGRDFGDVSPLRGVIVGGGHHRLSVRVSVQAE